MSESILRKASDLYDELVLQKKEQADVALKQAEESKKILALSDELKEVNEKLNVKAKRLAVYENIEECEKVNKAEAKRLEALGATIQGENAALSDARKKLQKDIVEKQLAVDTDKEKCQSERAALKKTQAELKVKQDKVDKFLAQVK